jgi:hypothetical protein
MTFLRSSLLVSALFISASCFSQWLGLSIKQEVPVSHRVYNLAVAHTNDDQFKDLITFPSDAYTTVNVFNGDEEETFSTMNTFEKQDQYRLLNTGDLDNDGIDDLVLSSYWGNGFKIYWGSASGQYTEGQHYGLTGHGKNLKVVDLNNDGALDIAALSGGSGQPITLHMFYGSNSRALTAGGIFASQLDTDREITIADKNQDGLKDILISSSFPWFLIYYQQTNGTFTPQYWPYQLTMPFTSVYYFADFNNDSKHDILAFYYDEGFRFYEGERDTLFSENYHAIPTAIRPSRMTISDLDQDGNDDIIFTTFNNLDEPTNTVQYMLGNGDFTFKEAATIELAATVENMLVADFNDDSFADIIVYTSDSKLITIINNGLTTGSAEELNPVTVYPNPFKNVLTLALTGYPAQVDVLDLNGRKKETFVATADRSISTGDWAAGFYLLRVRSGKKVNIIKLVKH